MYIDTLFAAAIAGDTEAIANLAAIADKQSKGKDRSILHNACIDGNTERVKFIVTNFENKNLLIKVDKNKQTALHLAAARGHSKVVKILVDAARRTLASSATDVPRNAISRVEVFLRQTNYMGNTALHQAVTSGDVATVEQLVKADPNDRHVQNDGGYTPVYHAAMLGYNDIVKIICTTCTAPSLDGPQGATALHAAISQLHKATSEDRDVVMVLMDSAKRSCFLENVQHNSFEDLFSKTDYQNRTPLSLAVLKNHLDVVKLILKEDPAYQRGRGSKNEDLRILIYLAAGQRYDDIVKILCDTYEIANTCHKGHVALIAAIRSRNKESVYGMLEKNKHLVTYNDDDKGWTALHYAAYYTFDSIIQAIVEAQKTVGYQSVYGAKVETPLIVAANEGYVSTVVLLMELLPDLSCVAVNHKHQNILHIAVVQNNKDMIQSILECCRESCAPDILNGKDDKGNTPLHLLISQGCFVPELIKHKRVNLTAVNNLNWTPLDMLYFQDEVVADQVKIKKLLDDTQTNQQWKFWRRSIKGTSNTLESIVHPYTRSLKDAEFKIHMKILIAEENERMKEELERYRKRTNTQIIVTALITTVTFTVGFTMPGGYHQSGEPDEGLVILSNKKAFDIFMVSDALALALSITSLFVYFISSMYDDPDQVSKFDAASTVLNIVSVMAMMLTFIAGIYVVLSHSPGLAITVCIMCSLFFFSIIVLLIKMIYDRKTSKKMKV